MTKADKTIEQVNRLRARLADRKDAQTLHEFAARIDGLGYASATFLDKTGIDHDALIREALQAYDEYLEEFPDDPVANNNVGALLLNQGCCDKARTHLERALRAEKRDANIHENLRVVDILEGRPESAWHRIPPGLRPGASTLVAYFDAQAM